MNLCICKVKRETNFWSVGFLPKHQEQLGLGQIETQCASPTSAAALVCLSPDSSRTEYTSVKSWTWELGWDANQMVIDTLWCEIRALQHHINTSSSMSNFKHFTKRTVTYIFLIENSSFLTIPRSVQWQSHVSLSHSIWNSLRLYLWFKFILCGYMSILTRFHLISCNSFSFYYSLNF